MRENSAPSYITVNIDNKAVLTKLLYSILQLMV